ncbi:MAG: class I SAM-dependent methyltransferase [Armatimonadota bacterium]
MRPRSEQYTKLQVPGLPGVYFRDMPLDLGGRALKVLTASAVDLLGAKHPGEIPYWCVAWPAGIALARLLAGMKLQGARLLEIGCGVGIGGLGAAVSGAEVLLTDNQPASLRVAMMNARRNDLPLRAAAADWRQWPLRERFELVVGSDVTYQPAAAGALLSVLDAALEPGGEALLTDPGRLTTQAFESEAVRAGWSWQREELPREGAQAVFLYRLRRA